MGAYISTFPTGFAGLIPAALQKLLPGAQVVLLSARKREAEAADVLDMVVRAIGDTIQILAQSVDPRLIVLGGGMAKTGEPLVEVIAAELRRRESQCRFLETLDLPARLRLAPVDQPVGAIGAAMAA